MIVKGAYAFPYYDEEGMPAGYRGDITGQLPEAVRAYWSHRVVGEAIAGEQVALIIAYLQYYIEAPCWERVLPAGDLADAREMAATMTTRSSIDAFVGACLEVLALDPL